MSNNEVAILEYPTAHSFSRGAHVANGSVGRATGETSRGESVLCPDQ